MTIGDGALATLSRLSVVRRNGRLHPKTVNSRSHFASFADVHRGGARWPAQGVAVIRRAVLRLRKLAARASRRDQLPTFKFAMSSGQVPLKAAALHMGYPSSSA